VKLIGKDKDSLLFHLGRRERSLLEQLFQLFPAVPSGHQCLSRGGKVEPINQQLLEESLAEHSAEVQKQVTAFMQDPLRWSERQHGWQLRLKTSEVESLLQVLNDIRVGSWLRLGAPEESLKSIDEKSAPHLWAMEIAGSFELALLHNMQASDPPPAQPL